MGRRSFLKLWKLWYIIIVIIVYSFLIYHAIRRYIAFKTQVFDPRHGQGWDHAPMNCYLAVLITSLSLLPMLLYSGLMRIGNYANDGVVLGKDPETLNDALGETGISKAPRMSPWQRFRRHFLPLAGILHATSAYLLLLPIPVLAAEQIRNEVYKRNRLWHSDLDFIFQPDSHHLNFTNKGKWVEVLPISPELCNYIFSLLFLTIRYPATFWYTSRPMALIFCLAMLIGDLHLVFENAAIGVLYKVSLNRLIVPGVRLLLSPAACLVLPALGTAVMMLAHMTIFEYGYAQFLDNLRKYSQYFAAARDPFEYGPAEIIPQGRRRGPLSCLSGYTPHLVALGGMVLMICLKAPVTWEMTQIFRANGDRLCLTAVVIQVAYLCFWIFVWLLFTLKSRWKFHINIPIHTISEITPQGAGGMNSKLHHDDGSPVYSCFHTANDPSGTDCCSEHSSSKNSSSGGGGTNYVFLQPSVPRPMIATISEHVDVVSESSYESRGGSGSGNGGPGSTDVADGSTIDPGPPGLLKYAVRRGSTGQASIGGTTSSFGPPGNTGTIGSIGATGSLTRNGRLRKSGNRVTFKEQHETIPGSPLSEGEGSSQNTSSTSDSGIDHHQRGVVAANQPQVHRDSYNEPTYLNQADFANYRDVYIGQPQHALPPDVILEGTPSIESSLHHLSSPYSSLNRPGRSLVSHMEDIEMHTTGDSGDPQLCSQV